MKTNIYTMLAGLVLATLAVAAQAADSPFGIVRRGEAPAPAPVAGSKLTFEGLSSMLGRMGYQPQVISAEGENVLLIQVEHSEGSLKHYLTLDEESGLVRINCSFTVEIGEEKVIPVDMYKELMEDTFNARPSYLRIEGNQVFIATIVGRDGLTAEKLTKLMDHHKKVVDLGVMPVIRKHIEYYPYQKAASETPAPAPAPAAKKVRKTLSS